MAKKIRRRPPRRDRRSRRGSNTVWIALLEPDAKPFGMYELFMAGDAEVDFILSADLGWRSMSVTMIRERLRAMSDAHGRPGAVVSNDPRIDRACAQEWPGISVRRGAPPRDVIQSAKSSFTDTLPSSDRARAEGDPMGVCAYSAEILASCERLAWDPPWRYLDDTQPLEISLDGETLPFSVFMVLGAGGQTFGYVGFRSLDAYYTYHEASMKGADGRPPNVESVALLFSFAEELPAGMAKAFHEREWAHELYPHALHVTQGTHTGVVHDRASARGLAQALDVIAQFASKDLAPLPRSTPNPVQFQYQTALGTSATLVYRGSMNCETRAPNTGENHVEHGISWGPFPYEHRTAFQVVDRQFLAACVAHVAANEYASPGDVTLPAGQRTFLTLIVKSTLRDARKGARTAHQADELVMLKHPDLDASLFFLVDGTTILGPIGAGEELIPDPDEWRAPTDGDPVWLVTIGGGLKRDAGMLHADRATTVHRLTFRACDISAFQARFSADPT